MQKEVVLSIVRSTREFSLPEWGRAQAIRKKDASAVSVVTKIDHEIESFLAEKLSHEFPDIGFAGEEHGGSRDGSFWLCDPIDGTGHFIRGLPFCTTMLALIENGEVTFSAIYNFASDTMYHAERGKGAYENDTPIHVSQRAIEDAYIGWETHTEKQENMDIFAKLRDRYALFKTISSGYEFALVASGRLDARIQFDPWGQDWDFAPCSLLVSEAGGIVANLGKRTYDYRNRDFLATNMPIFRALTEGPHAIFPIYD